jgi:ATP-dependent DNA ligase
MDGLALLRAAEQNRLEGVVSKRRDAPYRSGECRDWLKVKTAASDHERRDELRRIRDYHSAKVRCGTGGLHAAGVVQVR